MKVIDKETVMFKSVPKYFYIERCGFKPNTVRIMTEEEIYILIPDTGSNFHKIFIQCTQKNELDIYEQFDREITDISIIGQICGNYIVVISWKHIGL